MITSYDAACDFGYGETLLSLFLKNEIGNYQEPTRKGTPKGERIGFPRHKHAASLFMITGLNQRQIAERLGISHKLLLKWNMEPEYKEAIQRHCRDFVDILAKHLLSGRGGLKYDYPLTNDVEFYGDCVIEGLFSALGMPDGNPKTITDVYRLLKLSWMIEPGKNSPAKVKLLRVVTRKIIACLQHLEPFHEFEVNAMKSVLQLVDRVFLQEDA